MNSSKCQILLIMLPEEEINIGLRQFLQNKNFEVFHATDISTGLSKARDCSPDLIICQNKLEDDYSGFKIYSQLKSDLYKRGISFFIYMRNYQKEDVQIGLEMGIDNFILYPFDKNTVLNKIKNQMQKVKKLKYFDSDEFHQAFEASPVPKFIVVNRQFTKMNNAFKDLSGVEVLLNKSSEITDVFDFSELEKTEIDLKKCFNGLKQQCLFKSVSLKNSHSHKFDIYLVYNDYFGKDMFMAEVLPSGAINGHGNLNGNRSVFKDKEQEVTNHTNRNGHPAENTIQLTAREKEVLDWSSQGLPIKQIASILHISERTVEKHRANIMSKTKTSSIIEAIYAFRQRMG